MKDGKKKKKKLPRNTQNFHDDKSCTALADLFFDQQVASSTAKRPDGCLAGFVPS
jgi:hypothetical protein